MTQCVIFRAMIGSAESLLEWAAAEFKVPWERLCRVANRLSLGAELTPEEARVRLLFTPYEIDYGAVYPLVGHVLRTLLIQPARLATVVHDGSGRVIRAYHEDAREGHYVSLKPLELPESVSLNGPELLALVNGRAEVQGLPRVDWVKAADLRFFEAFREAGADGGRLFVAARTCVENGWIQFHPLPPAFRALFRWMDRLRRFDPSHLRLDLLQSSLPATTLIARGPDYTCVFDPWPRRAPGLEDIPFSKLTKTYKRAIAVRVEPLLHLVRAWLERDTWNLYETPRRLAEAGQFLKALGRDWDAKPRPSLAYTLSRFLLVPLDPEHLLDAGARYFLRGVVREQGESRFGLLIESNGQAAAAVEFRFRDGSFVEALTHPPKSIDPFIAFGYNSALPVVVIHLGALEEGARLSARLRGASWRERIRILRALARLDTASVFPESLGRLLPQGRRAWIWRLLRLPFDRK